MIDKKQYQRTFGVLHASGDFLKEDYPMKETHRFPMRKLIILCAAVLLILSTSTICYAKDLGGIQRTIQLWIHGDQTTAVMDIQTPTKMEREIPMNVVVEALLLTRTVLNVP